MTVRLADRVLTCGYDMPAGSPSRPLAMTEIRAKFAGLASGVLDQQTVNRLWALLDGFDEVPDTAEFFELLAARSSRT